MKLKGKSVCITGASAGIGSATAQYFAQEGCRIALGARRIERLQALRSQLLDLGAESVAVLPLDVQQDSSVTEFYDAVNSDLGSPDILVNNAGLVLGTDHIADGKISDWQTILDTNVMGVLRVCRAFIPKMKQAQRGHLIFVGSISGHQVYEGGGPYCASKHSVKAIYQTLKLELSGTKIRVSSVDPGMVETEFSLVRLGDEDAAKKVYEGFQPLTAEDIAECIGFIASRPAHVNIDDMIIMPREQATVYKVDRSGLEA
ncbi:SDR family NAD(P)-dependent oxidoreductase [Pseudobacteriovorax antillogorgiicola]|uniref:NADP-dependent 3-hydroxy acid dehydrogenase YdfG n=1 Tax=Pseudobacteriovorax antillogorgiicola TaxID=1513793 RepID=A0A1Y6B3S2_9BACT|nr:SDR family NAD(P)-dependent oxidoreductase [Pseudobacteriovorax antillogorgiicola]TCS59253.1 NADP-dependent 3-hydroxy acid dehydrogenase YdfG [Pseudobacteriovorax antillogorgiicola]SME90014.1 NADP-dependent 3-hydroxy acid dehydrogenase YdfG [Pseudobacteriovorax antillogorgiicola]